jgi:hypothetical protein
MLRRPIKFVDLDGVEREEEFLFNLSKTDLIKMEAETEGGLHYRIDRITREKNVAKLIQEIAEIVKLAYGERSDDGKRFVKSPEISKAFSETPAYDALIWELSTSDEAAATFFKGVMPQELEAEVQKLIDQQGIRLPTLPPPPPQGA